MPRDAIETDGELVSEERETIEPEDVPQYTIAAACDWVRRPENARAVAELSNALDRAVKSFAQAVDRDVSATGALLRDVMLDKGERESFFNAFTRSIWGLDE